MKKLPDRGFHSFFDKILLKMPLIGKILSSIFGLIEVNILELFRKLDTKYNTWKRNYDNWTGKKKFYV